MVEVSGVQTSKVYPSDPHHCEVVTHSGNPRRALDPPSPARIVRRARTQLPGRTHPSRRHLPGLAIDPTLAYDQPVDDRKAIHCSSCRDSGELDWCHARCAGLCATPQFIVKYFPEDGSQTADWARPVGAVSFEARDPA